MVSISARKNKKGVITSYTIRVYNGYDINGKRLKSYTTNYKPAPNMTVKQAEKEARRQALLFEEKCRFGYMSDNRQTFAEYVLTVKEQAGTKYTTITRYRELLERINYKKIANQVLTFEKLKEFI